VSGQLGLAFGVFLLVVLQTAGILVLRLSLIRRRGGVVACALRLGAGGPWRHGLAEYRSGGLCWYGVLSVRLRPRAELDRAELTVTSSRPPSADEATRLGADVVIAVCRLGERYGDEAGQVIELAMSEAGLTGLLAWLESSPQFYPRTSACG
jgi:hypothetical protein